MHLDRTYPTSLDCPLIRLFDFGSDEAARLQSAIAELESERINHVSVHELSGTIPINVCELLLRIQSWNQGMVQIGLSRFICGYTAGNWDNVAGLIEPFVAGGDGYQWLAGGPGEAALLLSVSGQW